MKRCFLIRFWLAALIVVVALSLAAAQEDKKGEGDLDPSAPKGFTPEEVIRKFAAKEKEFKEARDHYTYRQSVKVQTVDGDTVDGEYQQIFDVTFDDQGRKIKSVVFSPQPTLVRISMSQEDFDDIENRLPFVLTSDDIPEYDILYVGQQPQDELHCYVFDVAPKRIEKNKRYFQGRIWVDDADFQIVKTYGKTVPETRLNKKGKGKENLFPSFTTYREQIDGKYWFPTYTKADDILKFSLNEVHIREIVKYTNYQRFGSNVKITYEGQEVERKPGEKKPEDKKPEDAKPQ